MSQQVELTPFNSGRASVDFPVTILEDFLFEPTEFFGINITKVTVFSAGNVMESLSAQELSRIQLVPDRARVDIVDNDGKSSFCNGNGHYVVSVGIVHRQQNNMS